MARGGNDWMKYLIAGGVVYVTYNMGLNGSFGSVVQDWTNQIQAALKFGAITIPGTKPPTTIPPANKCSVAATGSLALMLQANPNIAVQIVEWQNARKANGENAYDWAAFAVHAQAISGIDPGGVPPPDFCK